MCIFNIVKLYQKNCQLTDTKVYYRILSARNVDHDFSHTFFLRHCLHRPGHTQLQTSLPKIYTPQSSESFVKITRQSKKFYPYVSPESTTPTTRRQVHTFTLSKLTKRVRPLISFPCTSPFIPISLRSIEVSLNKRGSRQDESDCKIVEKLFTVLHHTLCSLPLRFVQTFSRLLKYTIGYTRKGKEESSTFSVLTTGELKSSRTVEV